MQGEDDGEFESLYNRLRVAPRKSTLEREAAAGAETLHEMRMLVCVRAGSIYIVMVSTSNVCVLVQSIL